jgi:hypothetical protein
MGRDSTSSGVMGGRFKLNHEGTGVAFLDDDTSPPSEIITPPPVYSSARLDGSRLNSVHFSVGERQSTDDRQRTDEMKTFY